MKLKISFEDIKDAIESTSFEQHHFIDKTKNEIVFISEHKEDYENKLEEVDHNNFIGIPARTTDDDFQIMRSFIYKIKDLSLAQKFDDVLNRKKPFRNFRKMINQYPELRERWFEHYDKEIINDTMNWLCISDIDIEDKNFMPNIEIKELEPYEVKIPEEFEGFGSIACMKCNTQDGFKTRYFELNVSNENMLIDKEIKRIMKTKYNVENYGHLSGGKKEILTVSECPKCKSGKIFEGIKYEG